MPQTPVVTEQELDAMMAFLLAQNYLDQQRMADPNVRYIIKMHMLIIKSTGNI